MILNLKQLFKKYKIQSKGIIHVGAHHGDELVQYLEHDIKNILCFEPLKLNFQKLKEKSKILNSSKIINFHLENYALGEEKKEVEMFVEEANKGMSSSILEPSLHLKQYPHIVFEKKEKVKMLTLDGYFEKNKSDIYDFINIDVQGYELNVFKGAIKTLENIKYIMTEVNRKELYKGCTQIKELDDFLYQHGFKRKITNWAGKTWGDAFYIKEEDNFMNRFKKSVHDLF